MLSFAQCKQKSSCLIKVDCTCVCLWLLWLVERIWKWSRELQAVCYQHSPVFFPRLRRRPHVFDLAFSLALNLSTLCVGCDWLRSFDKTSKPCAWVEGEWQENYHMILIHTCKDFRLIYFSNMWPRSSIHMPLSLQRRPSHNVVGFFLDRRA